MDIDRYAAFLPADRRGPIAAPRQTWMDWRGRRIHIARGGNTDGPVRGILVHGGGGYSGALWPLAGLVAGNRDGIGVEIVAPDMPLYGYTEEPAPGQVRYPDWVDLLCDIITAERARDDRPIILFGASMGGMLAYEAAHRTGAVDAVLATCLLDLSDPAALAAASRIKVGGGLTGPILRAAGAALGSVRVPIRWMADMSAMSSNPGLSTLCATDPRGGGVRVPIGFLSSWLNYEHTPPERYRGAPVTLVAPAADTWTPPELSVKFLQRIAGPTRVELLENCGHYPIEEPGLSRLEAVGREVLEAVVA
ncbi:lysophospholipase [Mycobacterium sp. Root265]|uniref:alpha/beta hydrolase n=1 Tax=Mycobacterium sp. Root265 TaxID=1736504 RepID=UPI00070D3EA5|nr:alpha/beta hydrolase [Mycobacterium sp. Root265]KRD16097.1 lysophospholipase [Mycobacterium sp. Root265]